jgi:outer membrane lipoprotein carrier protein
MRTRLLAIAALLLAALVTGAGAQDAGLCGRTLTQITRRYEQFHSLKARFRHVLTAPALKQEEVEEGVIYLARGGSMRWEYSKPAGKLAVADGKQSYLYLPAEKQVYVQPVDQWENPFALRLLNGQARPDKEAVCRGAEPAGQAVVLKLDIKGEENSVRDLDLAYDTKLGVVTGVRFKDPLGNEVSFELTEIQTDVSFPPGFFSFQVPQGVRVVGGEGAIPGASDRPPGP